MGWSPPADSIIHASLISRALAEAISSEAPGADDLRCGAVSYNCQIGDSSIAMRVTCRGFATFDDVNSANDFAYIMCLLLEELMNNATQKL